MADREKLAVLSLAHNRQRIEKSRVSRPEIPSKFSFWLLIKSPAPNDLTARVEFRLDIFERRAQ